MSVSRRIATQPWAQKTIGILAAEYMRFVRFTSRFICEPADFYEQVDRDLPVIFTMWHGTHFLMPVVRRHPVAVMVSLSRDGELIATAAERLGMTTVRGSGSHGTDFHRKRALQAYKGMLQALRGGMSVALSADVPMVSRVAGKGIVILARDSQRPIYPGAIATSHRIVLNNWDHANINLPFSRLAMVFGKPIWVPRDADEATLEAKRIEVENALNAAVERAYAVADNRSKG